MACESHAVFSRHVARALLTGHGVINCVLSVENVEMQKYLVYINNTKKHIQHGLVLLCRGSRGRS